MTEPVSRTYQYRKVMKPMLERKRRARINRCLDELKELMTSALQTVSTNLFFNNLTTNPFLPQKHFNHFIKETSTNLFLYLLFHSQEGENVAKLEKADILELTVRHLHTLRHQNQLNTRPESSYADRFRAGFRHCAVEVTSFLNGLDQPTKTHLSSHLSHCIRRLEAYSPATGAQEAAQNNARPQGPNFNGNSAQGGVPAAVSVARQQPVFPSNHRMLGCDDRSPSPNGPVSPSGSATSGDENVWRPW